MRSLRRRSQAAAAVALVAGVVFGLLPGCSSGPPAGQPTGVQVQVPVLWVSGSPDGAKVGGVSQAKVEVERGNGGAGRYSVDLKGDSAQSTGAAWDAAAATASAVALLYSGQDPRGVAVSFSVSESIDGPSAGAVLTVGVLAALRGVAVSPGVAMTGTISPDGSVGSVGGIEAKVRAAAEAGYTKVLVPAADADTTATVSGSAQPSSSSSPNAGVSGGGENDPQALARQLGIDVQPIATVGEAMTAFTGTTVAPPQAPAPQPTAPVEQEIAVQTDSVIAELGKALSRSGDLLTKNVRATVKANLASAGRLREQDNLPSAYATATGALVVLQQGVAAANTGAAIKKRGPAVVEAEMIEQAQRVVDAATATIAARSQAAATQAPTAQLASINSLTWLTRSVAVLRAIIGELIATRGGFGDKVVEAATVLAQYRVAAGRIYPDSAAIAVLVASPSPVQLPDLPDFVAGYSELLHTAATANQRYYETVLTSISKYPNTKFAQPGHTYAAVQQLATLSAASDANPTPNPDASCAWALSYFLMSTYLVSTQQSYGLVGSGIGSQDIQANNAQALASALAAGADTVDAYSAQLQREGSNPDHAVWSAKWGTSLAAEFKTGTFAVAAAATGVSLVWDGALEVFMNTAIRNAIEHQ